MNKNITQKTKSQGIPIPSNRPKICMGHLQYNKYLFSQGSSDHQWMILLLTTALA